MFLMSCYLPYFMEDGASAVIHDIVFATAATLWNCLQYSSCTNYKQGSEKELMTGLVVVELLGESSWGETAFGVDRRWKAVPGLWGEHGWQLKWEAPGLGCRADGISVSRSLFCCWLAVRPWASRLTSPCLAVLPVKWGQWNLSLWDALRSIGEKSLALVIWASWAELLESIRAVRQKKKRKKKHVFNKP